MKWKIRYDLQLCQKKSNIMKSIYQIYVIFPTLKATTLPNVVSLAIIEHWNVVIQT